MLRNEHALFRATFRGGRCAPRGGLFEQTSLDGDACGAGRGFGFSNEKRPRRLRKIGKAGSFFRRVVGDARF
jgi:hypothetical protein